LHEHIEVIESGYEYLLAYAAQGRVDDQGTDARSTLTAMSEAAQRIADLLEKTEREFDRVIIDDANKAGAAIRFVLAQSKIGSEQVDNLNASIHLRALLTDLFLVSDVK
jgi:hypothetical protein